MIIYIIYEHINILIRFCSKLNADNTANVNSISAASHLYVPYCPVQLTKKVKVSFF